MLQTDEHDVIENVDDQSKKLEENIIESAQNRNEPAHRNEPAQTQNEVTTITSKPYTSQLAQLVLCGSSSWAVNRTNYDVHPIAFGLFTLSLGYSLLGIIKVTMDDEKVAKIKCVYDYSEYLLKILTLPMFNTQIYTTYNYSVIISNSHAVTSLLSPAYNGISKKWSLEHQIDKNTVVAKLISLSNISSLWYLGVANENYWAVGLSILCIINEWATDFLEDKHSTATSDYGVVALALFNVFAVKTLRFV